jgi:hypothetical protein
MVRSVYMLPSIGALNRFLQLVKATADLLPTLLKEVDGVVHEFLKFEELLVMDGQHQLTLGRD